MSGGKWEYIQYRFIDTIEDIKREIDKSGQPLTEQELKDHWNGPEWFEKYPEDKFHYKYPDEVIFEFNNAVDIISKAQVYMQRIDWLLSGDDGDDSFLKRLKEDLNKIDSKETYNGDEMRHLAINYAITCQKGYSGSFESWLKDLGPKWREIANSK